MVATRNHPVDFDAQATESPTKTASPTKRATRAAAAATSTAVATASDALTKATSSVTSTPTKRTTRRSTAISDGLWAHTPSNLTLIWLLISLPLVIWDTGYVLLRPHSMPGGWLHKPIWTPYELYGRVDHVYGFKAYHAKNGWTAAQGSFNGLETIAYLVYLWLVYAYGRQEEVQGRGAPDKKVLAGKLKVLGESRTLYGRTAGVAVLIAFSTALVTLVKTLLYWLIEAFNGFESIGHNSWVNLIFLWIIPNGAWIVFPTYMVYVFGAEIVQGLEAATGNSKSK